MTIADVLKTILEVTTIRQEYGSQWFRDAVQVRYALIDPIMWSLGWRTWRPEECRPDLWLGPRGRINYGLIDCDGELDFWSPYRRDGLRGFLTETVWPDA